MDKTVILEDGNIIKLNNEGRNIIIDKGYLNNGEPSKVLTMSMTDDFGFEAYVFSEEETDSVDFLIPQHDPLYKHFNTFLGSNNDLIIDDDMTAEEHGKYLKIQRQKQDILVSFYNGSKCASITDKFIITIINIMSDGRSIIDREGLDTKKRLITFFRNVSEDLLLERGNEVEER